MKQKLPCVPARARAPRPVELIQWAKPISSTFVPEAQKKGNKARGVQGVKPLETKSPKAIPAE